MPSSLRARSSIAASPDLRSATSAASAALRCSSPSFCLRCCVTRASSSSTARVPPSPNQRRYCSQPSRTTSASSSTRNQRMAGGSACERDERGAAGVGGARAQLLLDAQQLVVLGHAVAAAQRAGPDGGGGGGHGDVGDGGVLGLARTVRDHGRVLRRVGHGDGLQGLGEGADLVDLDQDGVGGAAVDAFLEDLRVGDEQVVAHPLDLVADAGGELLPAVLVVVAHAVLYRDDRVLRGPVGEEVDELF